MRVILYGHLRQAFPQKLPDFAVATPAQAVNALITQLPGFRDYMMKNSAPGYQLFVGENLMEKVDELAMITDARVLRIVPVIAGAGGNSPLFGIVLGVALMVVAPYLAGVTFLALNMGQLAAGIGFSLALGGVISLITGPPKSANRDAGRVENKPSLLFSGVQNTSSQGEAVPLCYGKHLCGSKVASAGFSVGQVSP